MDVEDIIDQLDTEILLDELYRRKDVVDDFISRLDDQDLFDELARRDYAVIDRRMLERLYYSLRNNSERVNEELGELFYETIGRIL